MVSLLRYVSKCWEIERLDNQTNFGLYRDRDLRSVFQDALQSTASLWYTQVIMTTCENCDASFVKGVEENGWVLRSLKEEKERAGSYSGLDKG